MVYVLIFAAGIGSRMGADRPKQFLKIGNKEIIAYVIDKFENVDSINGIIVVTLKNYINEVKNIIKKQHFSKVIDVIEGGSTAFDSQYNGISHIDNLSKSDDDIVLIHDGVRPFIDEILINECINEVKKNNNAIVVSPAAETIAIVDSNKRINSTLPRQNCLIARAPQAFFLKDLMVAHTRAKKENRQYIDSASMFLDQGVVLNPIKGPIENIKITTQYDYLLAKLLIEGKNEED